MFNSTTNENVVASSSTNTNNVFKKLALVAVIATASMSTQASELNSADIVNVLETRLSSATTEMLQTAKQDIMLNLHSQIAEQVFELNTSLEMAEVATETKTDDALASNEE
ncbi:hypothetical protein [Shewanella donghaensis]|uniref:hypothetical protein n=1 Tax=Shewanella donghaensis TaxID=238836 RepID=UPI001183ADF8|nr:hypothetical protein [Shewanella donghaensis]